MRTAWAGALALAIAASACGSPPGTRQFGNAGAGDPIVKQKLSAYVVEFLRRNPTTNTYLGGAGLDPALRAVDGALRDISPAAIEEEDRWLVRSAGQL